jgi:hypothetical protein
MAPKLAPCDTANSTTMAVRQNNAQKAVHLLGKRETILNNQDLIHNY